MLSVGLVVDDAIVMVENIERHLHRGKTPFQAAIDAARELVGPIIAMTITLAAVYAPVGIQGGLTGALFREFAFTLARRGDRLRRRRADAVADDGLEAAARGRHGARLRRLDQPAVRQRARQLHARCWPARCATGRSCSCSGSIVALLIVPFYMFSQKELAPAEDQGVVFGDRPGGGELDDRPDEAVRARRSTTCIESIPETASIFQITSPSGGFGGMVTKPWSERTKTAQQLLMESMGPLSKIPGIRVIPLTPPALPGGGDFPVDLVIASAAEPQQLRGPREPARAEGVRERHVHVRRRGPEVRPAAGARSSSIATSCDRRAST